MTTNEYIHRIRTKGWVPFRQRLWQRNYSEHIIRDAEALHYVRQYIAENPWCWMHDKENPDAISTGSASDP